MLQKTYEQWDNGPILKKLEGVKPVYQEPRQSSHYKHVISAFYASIYSSRHRGAIMLAVCRGKISEGLDFSDEAARCAILVGVPFPTLIDPRTIIKKDYLDKKNGGGSGQQWYC